MLNMSDNWWNYNETWLEANSSNMSVVSNTSINVMIFKINSTRNILIILVYLALFIVAAVGNFTVFISLFRSRHRKSRISFMIRHLTIADLIVTMVMIPIEVGWRITGRWIAGNEVCKIVQFLRALGPYLSSNILVCVSLDRYFAVVHPFRITAARRRGKILLVIAWIVALVCCVPQVFVFNLRTHPQNPDFKQCVTFGYFPSEAMELSYNIICIMFLYFIPLIIIVIAYTCIMIEISNSSHSSCDSTNTSDGQVRLRRSDTKNIQRTRSRSLRLTITIIVIYICCCTPYTVMTLWYMIDRESAEECLPALLQDFFFMMVVSNSCMNPIVYGSFVIDLKKFSCKCTDCNDSTDSVIPHDDLPPMHKSEQHFPGRFIKHFFGRQVNANITRSSQMVAQVKQRKSIKLLENTARKYPRKRVAYRFRREKFYSEVIESSTSSRKDIVFHSEPIGQSACAVSEDNSEIVLCKRRHQIEDSEVVQINPHTCDVYFVRNKTTIPPLSD